MTATAAADPHHTRSDSARPARQWMLAVAVALAVLATAWWATHPRVFDEPGSSMSVLGKVGKPAYLGLASIPSGASIHLIDVSPRVLFNDASATVNVVVCRQTEDNPGGEVAEEIEAQCASVRSPEGRADDLDHLVVEVISHAPGTVVVEGLDVTYRTPFQRGTQATGMAGAVIFEP